MLIMQSLLFGFKVLVLVFFDAANEPILRDNDVLRRKSFYEMVSTEKKLFLKQARVDCLKLFC